MHDDFKNKSLTHRAFKRYERSKNFHDVYLIRIVLVQGLCECSIEGHGTPQDRAPE